MTTKTTRDDKDYAIEYGEYLAHSAELYMEAVNTGNPFTSEHFKGLKSAIYEFRKRASRATCQKQ